jgi:putative ABC transport system ATP-binding protein
MIALALRDVWKHYGRGETRCHALNGIDLQIDRGRTVALIGASGSGKTTLMNLAAGLDRPSRGDVELLGRPLAEMSRAQLSDCRRQDVGFVFQTLNLLPALTVAENLHLPLAMNGVPRRERTRRVSDLLALTDLCEKATSLPDQLSTGQQQRVAVLRAVAHKPDVVFMDEPTSALDTRHAEELMALMTDLNRREGATVLIATHDPLVARRCSQTVHLVDGRVAAAEGADHD